MSKAKGKGGEVKRISQLPVLNPQVAGIDVSDTEMMVAFPVSPEQLEVRSFGCYTRDLYAIAACLKENGITSGQFSTRQHDSHLAGIGSPPEVPGAYCGHLPQPNAKSVGVNEY